MQVGRPTLYEIGKSAVFVMFPCGRSQLSTGILFCTFVQFPSLVAPPTISRDR